MKKQLLLFATVLLSSISFAQGQKVAFEDFKTTAGIQNMYTKNVTKTDAFGNIYTAGATINNTGDYDIFVTKFSSSGHLLWQRVIPGVTGGVDFAGGMQVTDTYAIITGGISTSTATPFTDVFTAKLAASTGTTTWISYYSGSGGYFDAGKHVVIDGSSNVYITGGAYNSTNSDFVTIKYNSSGVQQWVSIYDYLGSDDCAIKVSTSGSNLTIIGAVSTATASTYKLATLTLAQSTGSLLATSIGTAVTTTSVDVVGDLATDPSGYIIIAGNNTVGGQLNFYVQKINAATLVSSWTYTWNGSASLDDVIKAVAVDQTTGDVYISGFSTTSTNGRDLTLIKLNSSGTFQWSQISGFAGNDESADMTMDASANVYLTGYKTNGTQNYYTVKYSSAGSKIWEIELDNYLNDNATNICLDTLNNVIVAGQTEVSSGVFNYTAVRYVQKDIQVPIEASPESSNNGYIYYENKGQIINGTSFAVESDVTFATMDNYPLIFFKPKTFSYKLFNLDTLSTVADTIQRIDITLDGGSETAKQYPLEKAPGVINVWDNIMPANVTDIQGYNRLVASEVYTGIDAHYYSNFNGLKVYYVVKPGADPRNIVLSISGANTTTISGVNLEIQGINRKIVFDQPKFYQTNLAGTTTSTLATGTWSVAGTNKYKFNNPTYNNTLPLIIEIDYGNTVHSSASALGNIEHLTYYGGARDDQFRTIKSNSSSGHYVVVGNTLSYAVGHEFPTLGANTSTIPTGGTASTYMTLVLFDSIGVRKCANIYGTGGSDFFPSDVIISKSNAVTVVGNSWATTLPGGLSTAGYTTTTGRGFVVQFSQVGTSQSLSQIKWSSRLNGYASDIAQTPNGKSIYITSSTNPTTYTADLLPLTNAYNKSTVSNKWHYQISKFDSTGVRSWATYFPAPSANSFATTNSFYNQTGPGQNNDGNLICRIDCDNYGFYLGGEVKDTGLVIFNRYHKAIDSTHNGGTDAFVARFNSRDSLVFSGYVGGSGEDGYLELKANSNNQVALVGYSKSTQYKNLTYRSSSTQYIDTVMPTNATKMLISKVDSTGQRIWSSLYGTGGGTGEGIFGWAVVNDPSGKIYFTGGGTHTEFRIVATNASGMLNVTTQQSTLTGSVVGSSDAFLLCVDNTNNIIWNSFLGGKYNECGLGLDYNTKKGRLMMTGFTDTESAFASIWFPTTNSAPGNANVWFRDQLNASSGYTQIYSGMNDGYIGWFNLAHIVGIQEYFKDKTNTDAFNLFPNPSSGDSYLAFKNKLEGQTLIEIYSITGQLVYSNVKSGIFDKTVITLPTNNLSNGIYIVNVKNEENSFSKKLIISK